MIEFSKSTELNSTQHRLFFLPRSNYLNNSKPGISFAYEDRMFTVVGLRMGKFRTEPKASPQKNLSRTKSPPEDRHVIRIEATDGQTWINGNKQRAESKPRGGAGEVKTPPLLTLTPIIINVTVQCEAFQIRRNWLHKPPKIGNQNH